MVVFRLLYLDQLFIEVLVHLREFSWGINLLWTSFSRSRTSQQVTILLFRKREHVYLPLVIDQISLPGV